jgi:hypothetical protein
MHSAVQTCVPPVADGRRSKRRLRCRGRELRCGAEQALEMRACR